VPQLRYHALEARHRLRDRVLDLVRDRGPATGGELSLAFPEVSDTTVRRALGELVTARRLVAVSRRHPRAWAWATYFELPPAGTPTPPDPRDAVRSALAAAAAPLSRVEIGVACPDLTSYQVRVAVFELEAAREIRGTTQLVRRASGEARPIRAFALALARRKETAP
jgi:hypothetical protein